MCEEYGIDYSKYSCDRSFVTTDRRDHIIESSELYHSPGLLIDVESEANPIHTYIEGLIVVGGLLVRSVPSVNLWSTFATELIFVKEVSGLSSHLNN